MKTAAAFGPLTLTALALCAQAPAALAQAAGGAKPPVAQAWIDVATFSGMGMGMPGGGSGGMFGSLFAGGGRGAADKPPFLSTQTSSSGRFLDVTLSTRANPQLAQGRQAVPAGLQMGPQLNLLAPTDGRTVPLDRDESPDTTERPKGRILLYWGCGNTVRAGQPRVLDMATLRPDEAARTFIARRATQRGVHSAQGRPHWPNPSEGKTLADSASLIGEHQFSGAGVPEGFRFSLAQANDVMPALSLTSTDQGGATALEWNALPTARGYFAGAVASRGENEMVIWSSSEQPDTGSGLFDYQTNPAVERWVKEKVVLEPGTTRCSVPKGVLPTEGAMLRLIAYGPELNLVHPPRPADARAAWDPQWAVKLRVKSMATSMSGMPTMGEAMKEETRPTGGQAGTAERDGVPKIPGAADLLRGLFGR